MPSLSLGYKDNNKKQARLKNADEYIPLANTEVEVDKDLKEEGAKGCRTSSELNIGEDVSSSDNSTPPPINHWFHPKSSNIISLYYKVIAFSLVASTLIITIVISRTKSVDGGCSRKRMILKQSGFNMGGMGSWATQFRADAALAMILDANLVIHPRTSEHGYQINELYSTSCSTILPSRPKICSVEFEASDQWKTELHPLIWEGLDGELARSLKARFEGCDVVIDESELMIETALTGATLDWFKETQINLEKPWKEEIHLHVRWGDLLTDFTEEFSETRSTPVSKLNQIVGKLRGCGVENEVKVFAQDYPNSTLYGADFQHTIISTNNDVEDLNNLASGKFISLSGSLYSILAYQLATKSVIFVDSRTEDVCYWNNASVGGNKVVYYNDIEGMGCEDIVNDMRGSGSWW